MVGRHKRSRAHLCHKIANVDDYASGDVGRRDPFASSVEDFEAAGRVLMKEGEQAGVGMRGTVELLFWGGWDESGVVEEAESADAVLKEVHEGAWRFPEGDGEECKELSRQGLELVVELISLFAGRESCEGWEGVTFSQNKWRVAWT